MLQAIETTGQSGTSGGATPIRIRNLTLSFGTTKVLKGIDLDIGAGEFFAFLGPSGSGKSTLLRAIAGFGPRPSGEILLGERNVIGLQPWKRDVGMVFQSYALWPHMTVRQNVAYGLEERRRPAEEIRRRVREALELVGLDAYADRYPSQLSGGQQQRVALARTVVIEPKVLLLDEPLSNLDANLRVQMRQDLLALQRRLGITTIFVTHDQEEANTICDRIAVLSDGVVQQVGEPDHVYDQPANSFVARFLGTANILDGHVIVRDGACRFVLDERSSIPLQGTHGEGEASFVLRPRGLEFADGGAGEIAGTIPGTISGSEFLGDTIRYFVEIGDRSVLVDEVHRRGGDRRAAGTKVMLRVVPGQGVILAR
ncbi:ABC transporter ATP-binding protein [Stappia indica]|uniref:ABC transporter ATP-binding protein n=1 Tax=Stappia indica TaxID=538381 RepID=UPI000836E0FF|nr:ABC transporter ATP-binding protein [Stappia indica]